MNKKTILITVTLVFIIIIGSATMAAAAIPTAEPEATMIARFGWSFR